MCTPASQSGTWNFVTLRPNYSETIGDILLELDGKFQIARIVDVLDDENSYLISWPHVPKDFVASHHNNINDDELDVKTDDQGTQTESYSDSELTLNELKTAYERANNTIDFQTPSPSNDLQNNWRIGARRIRFEPSPHSIPSFSTPTYIASVSPRPSQRNDDVNGDDVFSTTVFPDLENIVLRDDDGFFDVPYQPLPDAPEIVGCLQEQPENISVSPSTPTTPNNDITIIPSENLNDTHECVRLIDHEIFEKCQENCAERSMTDISQIIDEADIVQGFGEEINERYASDNQQSYEMEVKTEMQIATEVGEESLSSSPITLHPSLRCQEEEIPLLQDEDVLSESIDESSPQHTESVDSRAQTPSRSPSRSPPPSPLSRTDGDIIGKSSSSTHGANTFSLGFGHLHVVVDADELQEDKVEISHIEKVDRADRYNIYPPLLCLEDPDTFPCLLPNDLMSHILSFFSIDEICRLFCVNSLFEKYICRNAIRKLRYVRNCSTPRFTVGRISHSAYDKDNNERMKVVMRYCRSLKKFKTQGDSIDVIMKIVKFNPNISHISILKSQYAGIMTQSLSKLVSISLHESPEVNGRSTQTQLDACELSTIHKLTISDKNVGRKSLTKLLEKCVNLKSLILLGTQQVPEIDFGALKFLKEVHLYGTVSDSLLTDLALHSNLDVLHISRINGLSDTSKILKILIRNQQSLKDLKLSLSESIIDKDLITHMCEHLPKLTRLTIEDPFVHYNRTKDLHSIHRINELYRLKIDNLQLPETEALFKYPLPKLESLTLKTCALLGCEMIAKQAPNLVYIRLNCCSRLTDKDIEAITQLPALRYLHIISNNSGLSRGDLTDKSVELCSKMDLYELTLIQYEPPFSSDSIKYLILPNYLPNLRKLKIFYGMVKISDLDEYHQDISPSSRDGLYKRELRKLFRFKPNCSVNITNPRGIIL